MIRTDQASSILGTFGFIKGTHEHLPIPQNEIDASQGALKQNNGY